MGCMSTLPHTPGYSRRSHEIAPFHVMSLLARAQALEQAGHDVIHLEIGEPDFTTAEPIVRGQAALAAGHTRYTAARGLPALRQAISGFYRSHYGLDIDPERILVTPGGSGALLLASSLLVDPGRHWLLADPGYPCNRHFLRLVEGGAAGAGRAGDGLSAHPRWSNSTGTPTASARWWPRRPTRPAPCCPPTNWRHCRRPCTRGAATWWWTRSTTA
jgi:hypothetical protein